MHTSLCFFSAGLGFGCDKQLKQEPKYFNQIIPIQKQFEWAEFC